MKYDLIFALLLAAGIAWWGEPKPAALLVAGCAVATVLFIACKRIEGNQ